ncbi:hypothetical protein FHX74_003945 [Friedmanniella endophytica]|uniref:Uncharacterized protein n=1 Tax=Microlunatus kandeliicorticis TaxID=1759536 RepID=A0A7W3IW17_9ACTN|nr:hypothetical protein [Microlunatus kandeliicorticis]MBA8796292.1 hypothetical protein [Microlunatus kandeliicorticis]
MFAIDHGQPGSLTLPSHLQHGTDPGCRGYARWAERTRLVADAEENRRERRALRRLRRQAEALRRAPSTRRPG